MHSPRLHASPGTSPSVCSPFRPFVVGDGLLKFFTMTRKFLLPLLLGLLSGAGCGVETYRERLNETVKLYEFLDSQNQNLVTPGWQRSDVGLSLRVPLGFRGPLAVPDSSDEEQGGDDASATDPRVDPILGIQLPGVIDVWESDSPNARLYVLSNHERFRRVGDGGPSPSAYLSDLEDLLEGHFDVSIPDGEAREPTVNVRYRQLAPERGSSRSAFTPQKDYITIIFSNPQGINGRKFEGRLYMQRAEEVQGAILVIAPQETDARFRQRLDMMLETFYVSPERPRQAQDRQNGTPIRSGGGTSGF